MDQLALLMARTHFSISTDETRAHVNSALFEWSGDRVRMVTTDGHRLSKMEANCWQITDFWWRAINSWATAPARVDLPVP